MSDLTVTFDMEPTPENIREVQMIEKAISHGMRRVGYRQLGVTKGDGVAIEFKKVANVRVRGNIGNRPARGKPNE